MRYLWGVRRYDVGDDPVVMRIEGGETDAIDWYRGMLQLYDRWVERHPGEQAPHPPELVRCALDWRLVTDEMKENSL